MEWKKTSLTRLEVHEVLEEGGADECGLGANGEIDWEIDSKVVRIGECLLQETRPLLANCTDLSAAVRTNLEHLVSTTAHDARARSLTVENRLSVGVAHLVGARAARNALVDGANHIAGRCLDGESVGAARAGHGATSTTSAQHKLAIDAHHFLSKIVDDVHDESSLGAAALAGAAACLLEGVVDLKSDSVHNDVFVVRLPSEGDLEQFVFLLNLDVIDDCEILETGRDIVVPFRLLHPIRSIIDGRPGLVLDR
ncbi:hypothetical protein PFISCL1PPCAC_18821, partial [Pristionchus fissidentatus]